MGEAIAFYTIAAFVLGFAVLVVSTKDTVHSVLFLVLDFLFVAALYVLLGAQFLAAIQVLVYAGGIVVLYLFVVMLVNLKRPPEVHQDPNRRGKLGFALSAAVLDTVRANGYASCYIRPLVYRGVESLGLDPRACPVEACIIVWEWSAMFGAEGLEKGIDVGVSSWNRLAPNTLPAMAKASANYANSALIKMQASLDGYGEAIALDESGLVSEGSGQNLFVVRDETLYTPPLTASILPGITRNSVITIAKDLGFRVREEMLPRELLYIADEAFFAGTAVEITPIRSVDKIPVGTGKPGPITRSLQSEFMSIAKGKVPDRHGWLTPVPVAAGVR